MWNLDIELDAMRIYHSNDLMLTEHLPGGRCVLWVRKSADAYGSGRPRTVGAEFPSFNNASTWLKHHQEKEAIRLKELSKPEEKRSVPPQNSA